MIWHHHKAEENLKEFWFLDIRVSTVQITVFVHEEDESSMWEFSLVDDMITLVNLKGFLTRRGAEIAAFDRAADLFQSATSQFKALLNERFAQED